ncbi:hypothetical protein H4I96_06097 [Botrytis cinerea]
MCRWCLFFIRRQSLCRSSCFRAEALYFRRPSICYLPLSPCSTAFALCENPDSWLRNSAQINHGEILPQRSIFVFQLFLVVPP